MQNKVEQVTICCDVTCPERFSCQKFARAMDVNGGKITNGYTIVKCEKFKEYEK